MERCGYLATLISLSIGAENSDLRNTKHSGPQIGVGDHYILHSSIFFVQGPPYFFAHFQYWDRLPLSGLLKNKSTFILGQQDQKFHIVKVWSTKIASKNIHFTT